MIMNIVTTKQLSLYDKHLYMLTYLVLDFMKPEELGYRDIMYSMKDSFHDVISDKLRNKRGINMNEETIRINNVYTEFSSFIYSCQIKTGKMTGNAHYRSQSILSIEG